MYQSMTEGISAATAIVPFLLLCCVGGLWVTRGEMTLGTVMAFIDLFSYLTMPVSALPTLIGQVRTDMVSAARVFDLLDLPTERAGGDPVKVSSENPIISLANVSFSYATRDQKVLSDISLAVNAGETLAIVGPSGSGKTTLLRLLIGLYDHYEGEIQIFGKSLRSLELSSLRGLISIVAQDTYLLPVTVRENILCGRPGATFDEVIAAAKAANAHDFIMTLPHGYDTNVGEFGGRLSGGQRQRISIARAILKDAAILLLDEPTSSLDTESEMLVQEAVTRPMEGRTTIVVAHRLSTIQTATRILVLENGAIVEEGSHATLLQKSGLYRRLYESQLMQEKKVVPR